MNSEDFHRNFKLSSHLASGGYGSVYTCLDLTNDLTRAVKIIPGHKITRKTWCPIKSAFVPDEVALWMPLSHPTILPLHEVYYEEISNQWFLVTDYNESFVDLFTYMKRYGALRPSHAANIIRQVIEAVYYLAYQGVDHRDLKDENILYNPRTKEIKLIDFGSASLLPITSYDSYQGTDVYIPPEYYKSGVYDPFAASVWAIGCLAFGLLNGTCAFNTCREVKKFKRVMWDTEDVDRRGKCFVEMCMSPDPNRRLSLDALIHQPWISV